MNNSVLLLARILLAQVFLIAGFEKLGAGYAATQHYMQAMGVPGQLLPLVIALEIGGSLALITGCFTRWAALALAGFCIIAPLIFHHDLANKTQAIMFMKDFAIAGGLLTLAVNGAGAFSVDAWRTRPAQTPTDTAAAGQWSAPGRISRKSGEKG